MKFKTNYSNRPVKSPGEFNSGEYKVMASGYRPNHVEVANLLMSGERLARYRNSSSSVENSENSEYFMHFVATENRHMDDFDKIDYARREAFRRAQELRTNPPTVSDPKTKEEPQSPSSGDDGDDHKSGSET